MSIMNDILTRAGLKFEELRPDEQESLFQMMEIASKGQITIENAKSHIRSMREAVEKELTKYPEGKVIKIWFLTIRLGKDRDKDLMLKARLRNYVMFEEFLSRPERAKEMLDRMLAGLVNKKK